MEREENTKNKTKREIREIFRVQKQSYDYRNRW